MTDFCLEWSRRSSIEVSMLAKERTKWWLLRWGFSFIKKCCFFHEQVDRLFSVYIAGILRWSLGSPQTCNNTELALIIRPYSAWDNVLRSRQDWHKCFFYKPQCSMDTFLSPPGRPWSALWAETEWQQLVFPIECGTPQNASLGMMATFMECGTLQNASLGKMASFIVWHAPECKFVVMAVFMGCGTPQNANSGIVATFIGCGIP